jgi:competence protein ComEC
MIDKCSRQYMFKQMRKGESVMLFLVIALVPSLFCSSSQANAAKSVVINEVELNQPSSDNQVAISSLQRSNLSSLGELKVVFIDVGQGDSTFVIFPSGKNMLIDGGEPDKGSTVVSTIRKMNATKVDAIVATHPHADHIGGLISVMDQMPVGRVYDSGQDYTTNTYLDYLDAIDRHKIHYAIVHDGDTISLDPKAKVQVFNPPNPLIRGSDDDVSNNSVVLKLTYDNFSIVFPGDVKEVGENRLAAKTNLNANVLLAAHHGSSHSNSISFLKAVTPETVIIYAGANNQYGFPSQEALNNFKMMQVNNVFRTDQDSSIILTSDGSGQYTLHTLGSNKAVIVPEFDNDIAVLIAFTMFLTALIVVYRSSGSILYGKRGRKNNQRKLG